MNTTRFWFEPFVESQLLTLETFKAGISWHHLSNSLTFASYLPTNYGYKLFIPYAKQTILWEIYFNPLFPELGPEIVINGEEFTETKDSLSLLCGLPELIKWDLAEKMSLTNVLNQFLSFFKCQQIKCLEKKS
ncbi:BRISC and BRCA1-A complex member 2, partial [Copidosoma floridanum]|uniref:BRISC and BRCA1-A complex member 2 n=1 Tax=Copidosoma floridanum TaxID=29053 RepID=UPI0006C9A1A9